MEADLNATSALSIWLVLGLALLLRALLPALGYLFTHDATIFYTPDSVSYIVPARELLAHHRFFSYGAPEILRTPGYPLLLTVGLLLGPFDFVTIVLQMLLGCVTVYVVYQTACLLFDCERTALIAAALYAIEPLSILFTSQIAPETLFTAQVMVGVYYLIRYLKQRSLRYLLASSAALALSVYVRPIGYFLLPIIAAGLIAWTLLTAKQNTPRLIAHALSFLIASFAGSWSLAASEQNRDWLLRILRHSERQHVLHIGCICSGRPAACPLLRNERSSWL
jgi:4-amino-4-deoxy-L-arabinose transferase-like glycosyltransferase